MARKQKRANGEGSIYRMKDGKWAAYLWVTDKENQTKRKYVYGATEGEARAKLEALRGSVQCEPLTADHLTVEAFLKEWLKDKAREIKPHTVEDYRYLLDKYVIPLIGGLRLSDLRPLVIKGMCSDIADAISPQRANKCRKVVSSALNDAVRLELIPRNPAQSIKNFKAAKREMKIWTFEEAAVFLEAAKNHRLYPLFYLVLSTGMRRGEVLGLRWQDVNGSRLRVAQTVLEQRGRVLITTPKTSSSARRIDLAPDVVRVLAEHKERQAADRQKSKRPWSEHDLVFSTSVGTPIPPRNLERDWYKLLEKAGVPKIRFHDLRHWHASVAIRRGMHSKQVAERLGHSKPSTTLDIYAHLFEEQREESAISIVDLLTEKDDGEEES